MQLGSASLKFVNPPRIISAASLVGQKEGEGPLGAYFDKIERDPFLGKQNWEEAESEIQKQVAKLALEKGRIQKDKVRYLFAGDLLGQLIATSFGTMDLEIPMFGLYGACSTMGESMSLGAMTVAAGYGDYVLALTSSHFASAEKQFRYPLEYGNQRPFSATWTVTGGGCVLIGKEGGIAQITGITTGKMIDFGVKDSMNMGAAMAPAAADTISQHFQDFSLDQNYYDKIITGDLGYVGQKILCDIMNDRNQDITNIHMDCGIEIFDQEKQDTHAGGSGCGCSAATLCSYILNQIEKKVWKKVLFVPTGALLSTVSYNEGQSIPGIAHGVVIEAI